jgi:catechol 2,3-dioxygenase-like lactoylglutathione lyase family enzyme
MSRARALRAPSVAALLAAALATACARPATRVEPASAPLVVSPTRDVSLVGFTVSELPRTVAFFTNVLEFEKTWDATLDASWLGVLTGLEMPRARAARVRLGTEVVELAEYASPRGRPFPPDSRSDDLWFQHLAIVVSDVDAAAARLMRNGVRLISTAPQTIPESNRAAAGIRALYFRDPDGHALELISFPPGKGQARWQDRGRLFLGIDHTAIAASDTDASLTFYRDGLGLVVAGESLNSGVEQEALSGVPGARVRITALRAPSGPGIELLQYLEPKGGRARPPEARANDLIHWETTLAVTDLERTFARVRGGEPAPSTVNAPSLGLGHDRATLVSDPDGHVLRLTGP